MKKRKGFKQIQVRGVDYQYAVGRNWVVVLYGPKGRWEIPWSEISEPESKAFWRGKNRGVAACKDEILAYLENNTLD